MPEFFIRAIIAAGRQVRDFPAGGWVRPGEPGRDTAGIGRCVMMAARIPAVACHAMMSVQIVCRGKH